MRTRLFVPLGLILILIATPFSQIDLNPLQEEKKSFFSGNQLLYTNDVPSWQIDDEWVYNTEFDVAGLLSQTTVPASVNTLTGETTETVEDITYEDIDGTQHLVYKKKAEGDYSSGNNGATLDGTSGRLDIEYEGEDLIRVSDLATISSSFSIKVDFAPWNLGIISQELADITILNSYSPPLEGHDFPMSLGEAWYVETMQEVEGSGDSDYFDPDETDQVGAENYSFQVSEEGAPTEGSQTAPYTGCADSYKVNQWNASGVNTGFKWYCPAVRGNAWTNTYISLGLEIDWILKEYRPANSSGVVATSDPGSRDIRIDVEPQFPAVLPQAQEKVWGNYTWNGGPYPNTNLQVRWEIDGGVWNVNTDSNGISVHDLSVGGTDDESPSPDDIGSHGIIFYDPVQKIVGVRTIILDPNVVAIDLAARDDRLIIERTRGNESTFLNDAAGWNAVPGDLLQMSLPAQNLGVLTSNATELEVDAPDGTQIRGTIPALSAFQEERVIVNWTVPENQPIGTVSVTFEVDPDGLITEDENLSNNVGQFEIYIGRLAIPVIDIVDSVFTFDNVSLDATSSVDPDGGDFRCEFSTFSAEGVEFNFWEDDCIWEFNWSDDGDWPVDVYVIDDENDRVHTTVNVSVINRAPWLNLTAPESIIVGQKVTIDASDHGDLDTITPQADVSISWPSEILCEEGNSAYTCTFTPSVEGNILVSATATDDDNDTTTVDVVVKVLNRDPSITELKVFNQSGEMTTLDGVYDILENEVIIITGMADDSINDMEGLIFNWWLDALHDENETTTTDGYESNVSMAWQSSGLHEVWVEVWDDDSATSERMALQFMVENVAPTLDMIPQILPVWEDQMVYVNATGSDSPNDMETWQWCWDLYPQVNSDGNGSAADDCDVEGAELATSWSIAGFYDIAVTVRDDDGAWAMTSTTVEVRNKPPRASISIANGTSPAPVSISLIVGDSLSLSAENSTDTATDQLTLNYNWDHSGLDQNGDGDLSNDIEHNGIYYNPTFDRVGTFTITLTVIDDNGDRDPVFIEVIVEAKPDEGLFSGFFGEDSGATIGISVFLFVILALLVVVLLRRGGGSDIADVDWTMPPASGGLMMSPQNPVMPIASAPVQEAMPTYAQPQPMQETIAPVVQAPVETVSSAPPLPAGGLPQGWTMEQWEHYGEQWLAQNMTASQPAAPAPQQPTQSNVGDALGGLLDDLDF